MKNTKIIASNEEPFSQAIKAITKSAINVHVGLAICGLASSEYFENKKNEIVSIGFSPENRKLYEAEIERIAKTPYSLKNEHNR